jgi:hypothetical protein
MDPLKLNNETEIAAIEAENVLSVEPLLQEEEILPELVNEEKIAEVAIDTPVEVIDYNILSRPELIDILEKVLNRNIEEIRDEVEQIKLHFYKKLKSDVEESKRQFIENGGEEADYKPVKDGLDETFKTLYNDFKARKSALNAKIESEREQNLLEKQNILEKMKLLVESNDDVSQHVNEFRDLQKKWKSIGQVPQTHMNEILKAYNAYQESFWDLIKINNELREYDFRKNLEIKTQICDVAEKLAEEADVVSAYHQLQKLHEEWHETGPVARDLRETIWTRFKNASSVINKKHQGHFDEIRQLEDENLEAKIALCDKIEAFDYKGLNAYKAWDDATQTIMAWQEEWRAIGFAPRKMNHKVFDRYRAACDAFFHAKTEFYKASKNVLNENLEKKKALCAQAEALKESTEWKETTDLLVKLQKEWKAIGPIPKKFSDELWKKFIGACDYFFEQKQKNSSSQKSVEQENLTKKKELIEAVNKLSGLVEKNPTETLAKLRELIAAWNEIGHVPFKEKDKIYKEYRTAVDVMFDKMNLDSTQRRLDTFKTNLKDMAGKGENKLMREREKLIRAFEHLKSEIATYENNIGFLTTSNKKGSGLIKEMERKIESLKEEAKLIEQKINLIEENL